MASAIFNPLNSGYDMMSPYEVARLLGFPTCDPDLCLPDFFLSFGQNFNNPEPPSASDDNSESSNCTLADIFRLHWYDYLKDNPVTEQQIKTVYDIMNCRTGYYGFNISMCDSCGHTEMFPNSCRNRHCPTCQGNKQRIWADERIAELLPVPYYHAVLTMTDKIFPMCLYNQKIVYDLILSCSAETIKDFGRDPKWLGAEVGFFSILHTWGQLLPMHPHVHIIIPGGGYDEASGTWVSPKNEDSNFLFPIHAMADVFRGKFIEGIKQAYENGELYFPDELQEMSTPEGFEAWINSLVSKRWVAYVKPPFGGPEQVVRYVSKYTHRVAISNTRIISIEDGVVCFMYKNYKKKHEVEDPKDMWEKTWMPVNEFIRRFLYHVLPPRYHRIRHYGFMGNGQKAKRQEILNCLLSEEDTDFPETGETYEGMPCPKCDNGILVPVLIVDMLGRPERGSYMDLREKKKMFNNAENTEQKDAFCNTS